jgi:hypothetical protein
MSLVGDLLHRPEQRLHAAVLITRGQQLVHPLHNICGQRVDRWVQDWPALIDDQFAEVHGRGCGGAGHDAAVRMAVDIHGRVAGALTVAGAAPL